ncbi:interferon-induced, double-stranded RNA-activated protein kinase isoform X2 [Thunnus thynnus]|uniref:interferon-induced, double-stranded RNA-activated protein kinase isoform X2 n=1 Tax=Thunnus thynnus TaxID=8237 RepID=UPI0035294950
MMETGNYVAKLNEYAQRTRSQLKYEDVGSVGPDHIKTFTLRAVLNGKAYPDGVGKNKKEAKHNAAKNALKGLLEEPVDSTETVAEVTAAPVHQASVTTINYICWLNEYGQRKRVLIKAVESTRPGPHDATQCCRFMVDDKEYPAAYGKTKREAKEEAAKLVYHEICGSKTTDTGDEKSSSTTSNQKEDLNQNVSEICDKIKNLSVKTEDKSFIETNFIGMVNHYCQKTARSHTFIEEKRCGPPHNPQFFYKLVINDKDYPVGEGKTIKDAKQKASQLAWSALQEQSDWDSKVSFFLADDGALAKLPTTPSTQKSRDAKSESLPATTSNPVVFANSSNSPKIQDQSPDVKPKRKIAAIFQNARRNSKEDIMANFNDKNIGNSPSAKTSTPSVISRFTAEFESIDCLGKGAFGRVFKAKQKLLGRYFAIKIVRCKEKALREVGALSDLHHSNIVRYYTCWMEDTGYQWDTAAENCSTSQSTGNSPAKFLYIQMELCNTKTLRVWIDERNTQNVQDSKRRKDSLTIATQIVSGVEYIHSNKLIHRDLKPANIMFGQDKKVKIGDFGLVTGENDDDAENPIDRTAYKGTPSYMAPEQKSEQTYDRKVDIFPIGLIFFELLWRIGTVHEREEVWGDARRQKLPQGFSCNFPEECIIIKPMLCENPEGRPEASKLKADLEEITLRLNKKRFMRQGSRTV